MRKLALTTAVLIALLAGTTAQATHRSSLNWQARYTALHGGITGSCWGCATPKMKHLARKLVIRQFSRVGSDAVRWALCVVDRESGFNPGAVNWTSRARGLFQFVGHPQYRDWSLMHDPVYQVWAAWDLSRGAVVRSHWYYPPHPC